jgi:hypothetical protein
VVFVEMTVFFWKRKHLVWRKHDRLFLFLQWRTEKLQILSSAEFLIFISKYFVLFRLS